MTTFGKMHSKSCVHHTSHHSGRGLIQIVCSTALPSDRYVYITISLLLDTLELKVSNAERQQYTLCAHNVV